MRNGPPWQSAFHMDHYPEKLPTNSAVVQETAGHRKPSTHSTEQYFNFRNVSKLLAHSLAAKDCQMD